MNTKLIVLGITALVLITTGVYAYVQMPVWPVTEKGGQYFVGDKTLSAGYLKEGGKILYTTRIQFDNGPSNPEGVRYDKFPVIGADPKSFVTLTEGKSENTESVNLFWGKDAHSVFYQGSAVRPSATSSQALDVNNFSVIPNSFFALGKDTRAVYEITQHSTDTDSYWVYTELPGVDPATFTLVGDTCAKDKNSFYTFGYYGEFSKSDKTLDLAPCVHPGPDAPNTGQ